MIRLVFGAGFYGRYAYFLLKRHGFFAEAFVVSDKKNNPASVFGIPVKCLKDYENNKHSVKIYIGIDCKQQNEIYEYIEKAGYRDIETISFPALQYRSFRDMSEKDFLSMWYAIHMGKEINWNAPRTFNEKIQCLKLYGVTDLMRKLTDKYLVREWVEERIGKEYLIPIYGVWNEFKKIDFSALPQRYVLKCNHGCGYNYIVRDAAQFNKIDAKEKFDRWINEDYGYVGGLELQYHNIYPRIIAEEYMENENESLYDYKFWCFRGKVEFVMYLCDRSVKLKMNNYDVNWNLLPFTYDYSNTTYDVPRPANLEKMITIAEELAKDFEFVRVDLYHLNDGSIKFGEMTFTPASGICKWNDEDTNTYLGSLFEVT